jgi:hypothetical protein
MHNVFFMKLFIISTGNLGFPLTLPLMEGGGWGKRSSLSLFSNK